MPNVLASVRCSHIAPAVALAKLGYHLLLEKPMATNAADCIAIASACEDAKARHRTHCVRMREHAWERKSIARTFE